MPTYAIVKTGGKQYRVETGQTLLIEKLPVDEGATVALEPLLYRGDDAVVTDGNRLGEVSVKATVLGHERGPKIRVFKFKPKRGYKRTTGHRQSLTRIQIAEVALGGATKRTRAKAAPPVEGAPKAASPGSTAAKETEAAAKPRASRKPASAKAAEGEATPADGAAKPRASRKPAAAKAAEGEATTAGGAAKPRASRKAAAAKPAEGEKPAAPKRTRKPAAPKPAQGEQPTKPDGGEDGA